MTTQELKDVIAKATAAAVQINPALKLLEPYNQVFATAIAAALEAKLAEFETRIAALEGAHS